MEWIEHDRYRYDRIRYDRIRYCDAPRGAVSGLVLLRAMAMPPMDALGRGASSKGQLPRRLKVKRYGVYINIQGQTTAAKMRPQMIGIYA